MPSKPHDRPTSPSAEAPADSAAPAPSPAPETSADATEAALEAALTAWRQGRGRDEGLRLDDAPTPARATTRTVMRPPVALAPGRGPKPVAVATTVIHAPRRPRLDSDAASASAAASSAEPFAEAPADNVPPTPRTYFVGDKPSRTVRPATDDPAGRTARRRRARAEQAPLLLKHEVFATEPRLPTLGEWEAEELPVFEHAPPPPLGDAALDAEVWHQVAVALELLEDEVLRWQSQEDRAAAALDDLARWLALRRD